MTRPRTITAAMYAFAAGIILPACAVVLGVDDPILDQAPPVPDGGADAQLDTTVPPDTGPEVAPVDVSDTCATEQADDAHGIFVSLGGVGASNCGSKIQPCNTITLGLKRAQQLAGTTTIYVDTGTYAEQVALVGGFTIQGGWDDVGGIWRRQCTQTRASSVKITGNGGIGVMAPQLASRAYLDTLSIAVDGAGTGQSLYGLFAVGATTWVSLTDVSINVGDAGNGGTGGGGANGTNTTANCTGTGGAAGGKGSTGAAGPAGGFSATGYGAGGGGQGGGGGAGTGTAGGGASSNGATTCTTACGAPDAMNNCATNATFAPADTIKSQAGSPGCGGEAGGGGGGGGPGGSTIAVYIWDAQVNLSGGLASAGNGGAGGNGGNGGTGAQGSAGTKGNDATCGSCTFNAGTTACDFNATGTVIPGGAAGAKGGAGGSGGQGGGGSGGYSYAVFQNKNAVVTIDRTALAHGTAGGGAGGAPSGKADDKGTVP